MMKKVIVFRGDLLPITETFIKAQAQCMKEWHPVLVGYRKVANGLPLESLDVSLVPGLSAGLWSWIRLRLCQFLGKPHSPTVRALSRIKAQLVHVHFGTEAVDLWPSIRRLGLPMLVTLHGYDINTYKEWWRSGKGGLKRKRYPDQLVRLAREPRVHFIAVSKAIYDRAVEFGLPADKITVSYIGINVSQFRKGEVLLVDRPKRILYVGRLVEKKGAKWLIQAFSQVIERMPDAELVIIGDGPQRHMLEDLCESLDVSVTFLGRRTSDEVRAALSRTRIFCLPSIVADNGDAEGLPIVVLEAEACGVPVVTSARGGAGESVIDGLTGYCVPEKNPEILRDRLLKLLGDENLLVEMGNNAASYVRREFDLEKCTQNLEKLYANANTGCIV